MISMFYKIAANFENFDYNNQSEKLQPWAWYFGTLHFFRKNLIHHKRDSIWHPVQKQCLQVTHKVPKDFLKFGILPRKLENLREIEKSVGHSA